MSIVLELARPEYLYDDLEVRLPRSTENVTAPDRRVDPFFFLMKELFRFTSSQARESEMATIFVVVLIDLSIGEESKEKLVESKQCA